MTVWELEWSGLCVAGVFTAVLVGWSLLEAWKALRSAKNQAAETLE